MLIWLIHRMFVDKSRLLNNRDIVTWGGKSLGKGLSRIRPLVSPDEKHLREMMAAGKEIDPRGTLRIGQSGALTAQQVLLRTFLKVCRKANDAEGKDFRDLLKTVALLGSTLNTCNRDVAEI